MIIPNRLARLNQVVGFPGTGLFLSGLVNHGLGLVLAISLLPTITAAEWHVSPTGLTNGTGSLNAPFASIALGLAAAQPGDTVWVHGGTYSEMLSPVRSGTSAKPITVAAWSPDGKPWNREVPVVTTLRNVVPGSGGVGTWQPRSGGRWSLALPDSAVMPVGMNAIALDGVLRQDARWPDSPRFPDYTRDYAAWSTTGALLAENVSGTDDLGTYTCPALNSLTNDLAGADIDFNPGLQWFTQSATVASKSGSTMTFHWPRWEGAADGKYAGRLDPADGDWFILHGRLALLTTAQEYFIDQNGSDGARNTLWVQQATVPGANALRMRQVSNVADLETSYINFTGVTFADGRVILAQGTKGISFRSCTFSMRGTGTASENMVTLDGSGHSFLDCEFSGAPGSAISIADSGSGISISDCTFHDIGQTAISSKYVSAVTVSSCTVWDTGSHGVLFNAYDSDYDRLHVYRWGRRSSDVGGINAWAEFTRKLNTRIHHSWVHDNAGYAPVGGRWAQGSAIRGDSGGNGGISGYTIDHCVVANGGRYGILPFALIAGQLNAGNADIRVLSNSVDGSIDLFLVAGALTGGFTVVNNVASQLPSTWNQGPADRSEYNLNSTQVAPLLTDQFGGDWTPATGSPLLNTGDPNAPFQSGYQGSAPDIGAIERGGPSWIAGARVTQRQVPALTVTGETRHDGSRWAVVRNLPKGRLLPQGSRLQVGGTVLTGASWLYDIAQDAGEAWFPVPGGSLNDGTVAIDLGDGEFIALSTSSTTLKTRIDSVTIANGVLTVIGAGLSGFDQDLYRLDTESTLMGELNRRPILVRAGIAALGASSDGANVGLTLAQGLSRLPVSVEVDRASASVLQGWGQTSTTNSAFGPALASRTYALRSSNPARSTVAKAYWPVLADAALPCRLLPESATTPTVTAGSVALSSPSAAERPQWQELALAGLPALRFDGGDMLKGLPGLTAGPATVLAVYRNTSSATEVAPSGSNQRLLSVGTHPDYLNGIPMTIDTITGGVSAPRHLPTLKTVRISGTVSRNPLRFGRDSSEVANVQSFIGWLGETLFFSRRLSDDELFQAQTYLKTKYRIQPAGRLTGAPTAPSVQRIRGVYGGKDLSLLSISDTRLEFAVPDGATGDLSLSLPTGISMARSLVTPVVTVTTDPVRTMVLPAQIQLAGAATDSAGKPLTVLWTQLDGPASATFVTPSALTTQVGFPRDGIYRIRLTAGNGSQTASAITLVIVSLPGMAVVENGTASYAEEGSWLDSSLVGAHGTDTRFSTSGSATASWTVDAPAGWHQIDVWVVGGQPTSSTAAEFSVTHGLGTDSFTIDLSGASGWRTLGWFLRSGAAMKVTLGSSAQGVIRADAVRTIALGGNLVDERTAGFSQTAGVWNASALTGFDSGGTRYSASPTATARWASAAPSGTGVESDLHLHWWRAVAANNQPSWQINVQNGSTVSAYTVDARTGSSGWVDLGAYRPATGTISVTVARDNSVTGWHLRADALRLAPITLVDVGSPGYVEQGAWSDSALTGIDGRRTRYATASATTSAQWRAALPVGRYRAWWWRVPHSGNAASIALAVIRDGTSSTVNVSGTGAGGWVDLGAYQVTGGIGEIRASATGTGLLRASVVRWEPLADEAPIGVPAVSGGG